MRGVDGYVFKEGPNGLTFVGDFDSLYAVNPDPWEQSGESNCSMQRYYGFSRSRLIQTIKWYYPHKFASGIEIGCGHGHVTNLLQKLIPNMQWVGADISCEAVARAKALHPNLNFHAVDVLHPDVVLPGGTRDVVLLGQLLWYLLDSLDTAFMNCIRHIKPGGLLVISQAFLPNQLYGRDIVDGFDGLVQLLLDEYGDLLTLQEARLADFIGPDYYDGLIVMRKK